jgi:hypothetical protein
MEIAMNTPNDWPIASVTPAIIDAAIRKARHERAEVMRATAVRLPAYFRRLAARLRPNRQRLPQSGAWA